jgi:8-oxo-dGTP diphosphatase
MNQQLRVAAYAVCIRDGQILLARWVARDGAKRWTLPGGGMDHGEHPVETVVREVEVGVPPGRRAEGERPGTRRR